MNGLAVTLQKIGTGRLLLLFAVGLALVGFLFFLTSRLTSPNMALLYGDLSAEDSSQIITKLEGMAVPYELVGNGSQVMVPSNQVLRLRVGLAEQGLPRGGSIGYEIFDRSESLGVTNFVQNVNLLRALEGELARTISSISMIQSARVHLVIPKRELFSREKADPRASIILKMQSSHRLGQQAILAIQQLVAAAVPGLKPTNISIVDNHGSLLARGVVEGEGDAGFTAARASEAKQSYEDRLAGSIIELLERSIGTGKVQAEVSVDMDFDRITTNSESYDPDSQVVRSTQTVEENASNLENQAETAVSVTSNLPDAEAVGKESSPSNVSQSSRLEETVNYEITKTIQTHTRESGTVQRITVAVLVDGIYESSEAGDPIYQPRSAEELEKLASLVRSAIGYSAERGDQVEVVNMQFARPETLPEEPPTLEFLGLTKSDYFRMAEIMVLTVVAILVLLLVVRPLITHAIRVIPEAMAEGQKLLADQREAMAPALAGPGEEAGMEPSAGMAMNAGEDEEPETMIDMDQVEGRVRAWTEKQIGEIVEKHPEEAVSVVRGWMSEEH
ncbi:MAG: flagellar M-ring protein FliF [Alphaproteobacteria bacterium]|nr:flagellar M-ring protein FliF [Alphaproteobacteria bacterium]